MGIHCNLILGGIADQTFVIGEGDIGRSRMIALVVGDDLNILPDTDAAEEEIRSGMGESNSKGNSRVSGAKIDTKIKENEVEEGSRC